ncbi:putative quinol monooxygenase [Aliiroseovarius sp. YM-037]|uniref:putative quinol monooxygenase n=1 Tax=Aliiroseovarius sp. YM-037 TaxID=3341728 RepID=UPI003A7FBAAE
MENAMIVEYLRYKIDIGRQSDFISDYKAAASPLLASPHAMSFDMCQCVEEPEQFVLRIEWTSADDHLKGFRGSQEFREFFAHIKPYLNDIEEMRHYERLTD